MSIAKHKNAIKKFCNDVAWRIIIIISVVGGFVFDL